MPLFCGFTAREIQEMKEDEFQDKLQKIRCIQRRRKTKDLSRLNKMFLKRRIEQVIRSPTFKANKLYS